MTSSLAVNMITYNGLGSFIKEAIEAFRPLVKEGLPASFAKAEISKAKFYSKWGYDAYRMMRSEYLVYHKYFTQFK